MSLEALMVSTAVVTLAEMGDKTQLLAFLLAARFKKPLPIIAGILIATILNHGLAGALGAWITSIISTELLRWILGFSFLGMSIWTLIPDKIDETEQLSIASYGVFLTTLIAFFLAEMGDKTQIATVALAANYQVPFTVVVGTTLGMLFADVPAVFLGNSFAKHLPLRLIRMVAAGIFAILGALILFKVDQFIT
jgi:putative Ca2+/H+ antiporter (TMEM165/GDT1 family)